MLTVYMWKFGVIKQKQGKQVETISTALKRLLLKIRRWSSTFLKMLNCYFKTAWCGFVLCLQSLNSNTEPASFLLHFVSFHHDFIRSQQTAGWLSLEQICTLFYGWCSSVKGSLCEWLLTLVKVGPDIGQVCSDHQKHAAFGRNCITGKIW